MYITLHRLLTAESFEESLKKYTYSQTCLLNHTKYEANSRENVMQ